MSFTQICNGRVITERGIMDDGCVMIGAGKIVYVGPHHARPDAIVMPDGKKVGHEAFDIYDAQGLFVCPGMIDVHIHGGGGADTMDGTVEALEQIARTHAAHGTTAFLATTMTDDYDRIRAACHAVRDAVDAKDGGELSGARILGLHLEGPYINEKRLGAQNPRFVRPVSVQELEEIVGILGDAFRLITLAPELDGALDAITYLRSVGVVVSMGHTDATFDEARQAFYAGVSHVTHMYNAMTPLHHRAPGVVGAALLTEGVMCEVIADGIHLHPAATRLIWQNKGSLEMCLVTDAIAAAGMPDGEYSLGQLPVTVKDGECRLADGRLAGSVLTMDRAVGHMVREVGVPLVDAVRMASINPARQLGLDRQKGSLAVGKDADITVLDADFQAVATWIEGRRFRHG